MAAGRIYVMAITGRRTVAYSNARYPILRDYYSAFSTYLRSHLPTSLATYSIRVTCIVLLYSHIVVCCSLYLITSVRRYCNPSCLFVCLLVGWFVDVFIGGWCSAGVYMGIYTMGIYTPKSAQVNFLWGKNDVRTAIQQFYVPKKLLYPPKNKFLASPLWVFSFVCAWRRWRPQECFF